MGKSGTDLLVESLMRYDINTRLKAVSKLLTSVMLEKGTMELKSNVVFGDGVSIVVKAELKLDENEKRIYWLDVNDTNHNVLLGTSDENIQEFISLAEQQGNVASVDFFINDILNSDEIETSNNLFKYI